MADTATVVRAPGLRRSPAMLGLACALVLMGTSMLVPWAFGWNVHAYYFPPLEAKWAPRIGPGTLPSLVIATLGITYGGQVARTMRWPRLLLTGYVAGVAWMVSLATVDGWGGIGTILNTGYEYLATARATNDISATLHEYVARIPYSAAPNNWPPHVAGHPPGALLFFVLLVRLGLAAGLAAGWVVILVAATTPVAVLITVRRLGSGSIARTTAPFLVLGPAAVLMAVSADAVFAAVASWALCCLAVSATSARRGQRIGWAIVSGLLFGCAVMMSYGLPLLGILAIAVLVIARRWEPLPIAAVSASVVVAIFWVAGFNYVDGFTTLHDRYWQGSAAVRPAAYWLWGDLAALCFCAGPILGSSIAMVAARLRRIASLPRDQKLVVTLTAAASTTILLADASLMSKAEVERIWLPFVPWLLLGCALLPISWRRSALAAQIVAALLLQHILRTRW